MKMAPEDVAYVPALTMMIDFSFVRALPCEILRPILGFVARRRVHLAVDRPDRVRLHARECHAYPFRHAMAVRAELKQNSVGIARRAAADVRRPSVHVYNRPQGRSVTAPPGGTAR